ncbi:RNA polymerase sigma-70 factor [Mucilaginibacter sp. PAMB04274]|uniref:RNA polymerase sigma factor n=1 Tax=Mucilaginibacter sp. PAMB04274 TaxID=3138568 RepID=UPI0031F665EC
MEVISATDLKLLVSQLRDGNRHAFNSLYRYYSQPLLKKIKTLVKNEEDAQEILQDVFLRLWSARTSLDPERFCKRYLYQIASNLIHNHLRNLALAHKKEAMFSQDVRWEYFHVEEQLIEKENEDILNTAIENLSEQCRKVYILSKIDGKSHREISEILKLSIATVNNHMVKGNREIREFFMRNAEMLSSLFFVISACIFPK